MSRYGWSSSRDQIAAHTINDDDFSYITSEEIDDPNLGYPATTSRGHRRSHSGAQVVEEEDVLLVKNKGVIYPAKFPAYAIGEGKLLVSDVKQRVCIMMDLPTRMANKIKLIYKGRQLKDPEAPVREYGVKNKSEVMATLPQGEPSGSTSEEEEVIVDGSKSRRRKKKKGKKASSKPSSSDQGSLSPAGSAPAAAAPPSGPAAFDSSLPSAPKAAANPEVKKLNTLQAEYRDKWAPLARKFISSPPEDPKKRAEEHTKITESIMQQILLKLDGVEPNGNAEIRARRKQQVQEVNALMSECDAVVGKKRES